MIEWTGEWRIDPECFFLWYNKSYTDREWKHREKESERIKGNQILNVQWQLMNERWCGEKEKEIENRAAHSHADMDDRDILYGVIITSCIAKKQQQMIGKKNKLMMKEREKE